MCIRDRFKINEEMEHSPYRVLNANDEAEMLRARVLLSRSKEPNRQGEYSFTLVSLLRGEASRRKVVELPDGCEGKLARLLSAEDI